MDVFLTFGYKLIGTILDLLQEEATELPQTEHSWETCPRVHNGYCAEPWRVDETGSSSLSS